MTWWDLRGRTPQGRDVSVAFYRGDDSRIGIRLSTDSLHPDDIAAAVEAALSVAPSAADWREIGALLLYGGTSLSIRSSRLAGVGAALLERGPIH